MPTKLKTLLCLLSILVVLFTTSCVNGLLKSNYYLGINGMEILVDTNKEIKPDRYNYFKYMTIDEDVKGETIMAIEFNLYSNIYTNVNIRIRWLYYGMLETEIDKDLYKADHHVSIGQNFFSFELDEKGYYKIRNNKTQYLYVYVYPLDRNIDFKWYMDVPHIFSMKDSDEKW